MITVSANLVDAITPIINVTVFNAREKVMKELFVELQKVYDKFISECRTKLEKQIEIDVRTTLIKLVDNGMGRSINVNIYFKDSSEKEVEA